MYIDLQTSMAQRIERRFHFISLGSQQIDFAAGNADRAGIAARFDPVRHDTIGAAV